ncbi:hypothetical protein BCR36DRAFT_316252 [Piromyces finnis]|uniref:GYF domain-containing protein n=1 Tax=Piromyces finnis TaxID=1754191 RepID=A0A1Y1VM31_9FUNG|nr:hypothetical protein BCR36DRAFT_316252 [Piromyces finnis]|eukprot:ORX59986.1 hypothetical protein BCR36DRAFT_316252 [Piromyces finnis]
MSMNFGPEWMRKKIPANYDGGSNLSNINNNSMDNFSKGKAVMNDHKVGSNKYSRDDVISSLWNNKKKPINKKMSYEYDNKNISSTTEPLNPMSMMSFNNYDKKILGQNSVNNDMNSRPSRDFSDRSDRNIGHFKDRSDNRMNPRPFSYSQGSFDQINNGSTDYSLDANKKIGNIWESQNRTSSYIGNNGMYSLKNNKNDITKKPKFKSFNTPLDKNLDMDSVQANNIDKLTMKDNSNDLTSTFDNMSLKTNFTNDKPLNNSLFNNDIFSSFKSNSLNVAKTQSFDDTMKKNLDAGKLENSRLQGNIFNEPDSIKDVSKEIVVEPPKWNYKDPTGKIQGPFLYEEMQEWYNAGYFEKTLPIKKENEADFKTLASMIEQYGEEKPFIIDAENYIKKERELKANEVVNATSAVQPPITSTSVNSKPAIKPIQKTMPSSLSQPGLETNVTSSIGNKTLPMSSYSVGGGIGLGRGIGMKENNTFGNNLDSMYNSFNNNSINSPKVYSGRNASFPTMSNHYEPVGYPGMNRLSNTMNNPQMMGIPGNQPWMPYNDPSMLGMKGWNDMMGFNDIYSNQFYNYDLMNPDLNKSNFNQQFYYQQLMQQSQQFPPQYYQMMRQMPQNQMPMFNVFGQPINTVGMKPIVSNTNTIGSMQNEIIPPMNTTTSTVATNTTTTNNTQSLFANNETNQSVSQNTTNMWDTAPQNTLNNININTNKAEFNKTDSIPNVDNTNINKQDESTQPSNNIIENVDNTQKEDIANDIPINEANTDKDEVSEEINEEKLEQNEEPETETTNEDVQDDNENEEELIEDNNDEEETENIKEEENESIEAEEAKNESVEDNEESPVEEAPEDKEEVVMEEIKKPVAPAPVKNHWKVSTNKTQRLSIKEIQEMEEKEKLEQLKKQQQEIKEKKEIAEAMSAEVSPISISEPTTVWGAPQNNIQKPTLRQIMQEEENNKKQKDLQMKEAEGKKANKQNSHVVVNTTRSVWAGRPLTIIADGNSQVVSASSLNAAKKEPVKKEIISTVNQNRPQPSQVSTSTSNTPTTSRSENEWTPVGKTVVKKSEPVHKITKTNSKSDNSKKGPSDAFMKWCKNALRVSTSAGVNVDDFINVLLLMPLNESSVIYDICNDTLGGITAIDPLKFAEEFIKRRKMDQNDQSFSAVRGYSSYAHDESKNSNKFIPVKGSGRKKNRQNLN